MEQTRFVVCVRELSMSQQSRDRRNLWETSYKTPYKGQGFCWSLRSVWEDGIGKRFIVVSFLGNHKFPSDRQLFEQILETMVGCNISLKICFLHFYLDILPADHGDINVERNEMLHQDACTRRNGIQVCWMSTSDTYRRKLHRKFFSIFNANVYFPFLSWKVKAVLQHVKQALRGCRGIALPILNLSARRGQHQLLVALPMGRRPSTHCTGGWLLLCTLY